MARFSKEYLEKTIRVWQRYSPNKLTIEDAREIAENMIGLCAFIYELEQKNGKSDNLFSNNWN